MNKTLYDDMWRLAVELGNCAITTGDRLAMSMSQRLEHMIVIAQAEAAADAATIRYLNEALRDERESRDRMVAA